jgi:tetratricopeptide (TPR) repeat protein
LGRLGVALIWSYAFDEGLDVATRAGEQIAAAEGPAAAAEYLAGAALTMGVTGNNPRAWALAQQGLPYAGDRRDLVWARLVVLDYQRREWGDAEHPGIALDTPERWEAARILQNSNPDPVSIGLLEAPFADRAEARARSGNISVLCCFAGDFSGALPLAQAAAVESLSRGQLIRAARSFMTASQCLFSLGNLAEGRKALEEAERLAAPGGSPVFGIRHARECLVSLIDEDEALAGVVTEFADLLPTLVPGQAWAVGPTLAILARTTARLGRVEEALGYLERLVPWLERAPAWSHHGPHIVGYAAETLWWLERLEHADLVERALQEKVIAPDFRDMEVDARLGMAWLRTLAGRYDEAQTWFAEARRVLGEQGARPLLAVTDFSEGLMYRRRGAGAADGERAATLLEAARSQFGAIGMTGWAARAERLLA